jgi:hypothetical protein
MTTRVAAPTATLAEVTSKGVNERSPTLMSRKLVPQIALRRRARACQVHRMDRGARTSRLR